MAVSLYIYACTFGYMDLSLALYVSVCVYFHVYSRVYVCTQTCTAVCTYISVHMDIGPYRYKAIWGESTLVWGFFPGEGRGEPGWAVTLSPSQLFWGCVWGSSTPPPHASGFMAGAGRQWDVG